MSAQSSAIQISAPPLPARTGLAWGVVGVTAFSFTVPFTSVATEGMPALFVGSGRAVVAALLAVIVLAATRQAWPSRSQRRRLAVVAGGVVVGFPLLTSLALTSAPAGHAAVVIGVLPAATAVVAVLRTREPVTGRFWAFALVGALAAVGFASLRGGGFEGLHATDLLLLGAVLAAAVGYAEGGLLARELGAWQTVSWAVVLCAPLMVVLAAASAPDLAAATPTQWLAFGYLGVVSMYLGFFAWYRGLALGPMAEVSQVQLVQPVLSIAWAAMLLGEDLTWPTVLGGLAVIACARLAVRARLRRSDA